MNKYVNKYTRPLINRKAFTLVELLIVLVIIVVLMAFLIPTFFGFINKSKETVCVSNRRSAYIEGYVEWVFDFNVDITEIKKKYSGTCPSGGSYRFVQTKSLLNVFCSVHKDLGVSSSIDKIISDANDYTTNGGSYPSRESIIEKLQKEKGLEPVGDDILSKTGDNGKELYWRPYYLGDYNNPQTILFGAPGKTGTNGWRANVLYVNGTVYKVDPNVNISSFNKYRTFEELMVFLDSPGSGFTKTP